MGDHELLQRYSERGSNEAFAELVRRHLNLVYSAARRQVRSPHLAEEVTQAVFFDLSRCARKLKPAQPLAAWLFVVTRRTAIDALRRETRRSAREKMIAEVADRKNAPDAWTEIEPLLDEAVASLNEADRAAILLRFFENKSLREIGEALGASDDAAQKRVTRAIGQLRRFFGKHGVAVSAGMLGTHLSAQAVQAAPPALLGALVSGTAVFTATAAQVSHLLVMTTLKKVGLAAAFAVVTGVGVYQARELSLQRESIHALERRLEGLIAENRDLLKRRAQDAAKLAQATDDLASAHALATAGDPAVESALEAWLGRVQSIKDWLAKMPDKRIPQMALLTEDDWLDAAKNAKVDTEFGARRAISELRADALRNFSEPFHKAVRAYLKANGNVLPTSALQLMPHFDSPIDPTMLENFEIAELKGPRLIDETGKNTMPTHMLANKVVDDLYDTRIGYTATGHAISFSLEPAKDAVYAAARAFRKANSGQAPKTAAELAPYLEKPVPSEYVKYVFEDAVKW